MADSAELQWRARRPTPTLGIDLDEPDALRPDPLVSCQSQREGSNAEAAVVGAEDEASMLARPGRHGRLLGQSAWTARRRRRRRCRPARLKLPRDPRMPLARDRPADLDPPARLRPKPDAEPRPVVQRARDGERGVLGRTADRAAQVAEGGAVCEPAEEARKTVGPVDVASEEDGDV